MMIKVETLDKCTLLQACEWIAFKWEPMDKVYEQYEGRKRPEHPWLVNLDFGKPPKPSVEWDKYNDELTKASAALKIVLTQKQLKATGILFTNNDEPLGGAPLQPKRILVDFEDFFSLDVRQNLITVANKTLFSDIAIDFAELSSIFPGQTRKQLNKYKSKYMLLMEEVVNQEGITDKNQSKQDILKDIIAQKMKEKKLPESNNLASAMATLIRQPWAQAGRKKKG